MNPDVNRMCRPAARGSVLIELALVLPILITTLAFLTLFGRYFWYYDVAQKAANDGARFLSTATPVEMRTVGDNGGEPAVAALARTIVMEELAEVAPHVYPMAINVQCDFNQCLTKVPQTVRVSITMYLQDDIFGAYTSFITGQDGMPINADVTVRYAGN